MKVGFKGMIKCTGQHYVLIERRKKTPKSQSGEGGCRCLAMILVVWSKEESFVQLIKGEGDE